MRVILTIREGDGSRVTWCMQMVRMITYAFGLPCRLVPYDQLIMLETSMNTETQNLMRYLVLLIHLSLLGISYKTLLNPTRRCWYYIQQIVHYKRRKSYDANLNSRLPLLLNKPPKILAPPEINGPMLV
jgi:hypothetical protein